MGLTDLLRRRRTDLKNFLSETGIVTYELLKTRCSSMGVVPPPEADFKAALGNPVTHNLSSPTEGIVVLEAPPEVPEKNPLEVEEESAAIEAKKPLPKGQRKRKSDADADST